MATFTVVLWDHDNDCDRTRYVTAVNAAQAIGKAVDTLPGGVGESDARDLSVAAVIAGHHANLHGSESAFVA